MAWKQQRSELKWWRVGAALAFVVMVTVNALANILPLNGRTTGEISDAYSNLFAPIGFTFSIWGVIYLLLAGFTLYQLGVIKLRKATTSPDVTLKVLQLFTVSSLLNSVWIFAWHFDVMWLTVVLIAGLLATLIAINMQLRRNKKELSGQEWLLVVAPFRVYFGWITVATIANVVVFLVSTGWTGWNITADVWTIGLLMIGAAIGLATLKYLRDWAYGAVLVWAYIGILGKHLAESGWNGQYTLVLGGLYVLVPLLAVATVRVALQLRR